MKAPPTPGSPSWWRDPIVKDGTSGPVGAGYLWGPADAALPGRTERPAGAAPNPLRRPPRREPGTRGPTSIGGLVFLFALIAGGLGTGLSWESQPLGTSLQYGLAAALAVFGLGMLVSAFLGRTGFGTVMLSMITAVLLACASALPKDISTQWVREGGAPHRWPPSSRTTSWAPGWPGWTSPGSRSPGATPSGPGWASGPAVWWWSCRRR